MFLKKDLKIFSNDYGLEHTIMAHHRNKCNIMMIKYNLFIKLQCEHVNMQIGHLLALYTVNQKQKSIVLPGTRLMP